MEMIDIDRITYDYEQLAQAMRHYKRIVLLVRSIKEFGMVAPIIITKNYVLIDGLFRLIACRRLKKKMVLCQILSGPRNPDGEIIL
jgi:ParB-like chromosome segregation protein Spo0J